jgi:hypothetical protein
LGAGFDDELVALLFAARFVPDIGDGAFNAHARTCSTMSSQQASFSFRLPLAPLRAATFLATSKPVLLSMKLLAASLLIACATAQSIVSKIPVVVCTEAF